MYIFVNNIFRYVLYVMKNVVLNLYNVIDVPTICIKIAMVIQILNFVKFVIHIYNLYCLST